MSLDALWGGEPGRYWGRGTEGDSLISLQDGYLTQGVEGESPRVDLYTYHNTSGLFDRFICHSSCDPFWELTARDVYTWTYSQMYMTSCKNPIHEIFWSKYWQFDAFILASQAIVWQVWVWELINNCLTVSPCPPLVRKAEPEERAEGTHCLSLWLYVP